jgi:hypothetical protein
MILPGCARLRRVKRSRSGTVMVHELTGVADWAARLRRVSAKELERALDAPAPSAGEALVQSTVDESSGGRHVLIPLIHAALPPFYDFVDGDLASALHHAFGNQVRQKVSSGASTHQRKSSTAWCLP